MSPQTMSGIRNQRRDKVSREGRNPIVKAVLRRIPLASIVLTGVALTACGSPSARPAPTTPAATPPSTISAGNRQLLGGLETLVQEQATVSGDLNAAKGTTFNSVAMSTAYQACNNLISNIEGLEAEPVPQGFTTQMSDEFTQAMASERSGAVACIAGINNADASEVDTSTSQFQTARSLINQLSIQLGA